MKFMEYLINADYVTMTHIPFENDIIWHYKSNKIHPYTS